MVCGSDKSAKMNIKTSKSAVALGRRIRTLRMGLNPYTTPHYRDFSLSEVDMTASEALVPLSICGDGACEC